MWRCVLDEGNPLRNGIWPTVRALVAVVSVLLHLSSSCLKPSPHRYGIMFKNGIYFLVSRPHERYLFWVPGNKAVWERAQMWRNFKTPFRWFCVDREKKVCFVNTDATPRVLGMFCPRQGWSFFISLQLYMKLLKLFLRRLTEQFLTRRLCVERFQIVFAFSCGRASFRWDWRVKMTFSGTSVYMWTSLQPFSLYIFLWLSVVWWETLTVKKQWCVQSAIVPTEEPETSQENEWYSVFLAEGHWGGFPSSSISPLHFSIHRTTASLWKKSGRRTRSQ